MRVSGKGLTSRFIRFEHLWGRVVPGLRGYRVRSNYYSYQLVSLITYVGTRLQNSLIRVQL